MDAEKEEKDTLIATYMHLTKEVLPSMARSDRTDWPVSEDHCFQRIVLDTICSGGAGNWKPILNHHFQGRDVVIVPDNDAAGRTHAQRVAQNLFGVANSLKILELPGLPEKGDVFDWLANGNKL
ncbi:hypothetical protein N9P08_03390 [Alphaproteobacteria bacterium]|nr:hypothetical protein [Alphaproteobacteria bacterium]